LKCKTLPTGRQARSWVQFPTRPPKYFTDWLKKDRIFGIFVID